VTGSRSDPEGALVTSEIVRPEGGPPIKVDWQLSARDGLYKISDVIIDGISTGASERSEFGSVIQRSGGQVQGLLAMMRERIAGRPLETSTAPPVVGSNTPVR
jgi:phospholipid transport system substrate-binding protein